MTKFQQILLNAEMLAVHQDKLGNCTCRVVPHPWHTHTHTHTTNIVHIYIFKFCCQGRLVIELEDGIAVRSAHIMYLQ